MNKFFDLLNNFAGWGDPHRSIWFVGIEESGEWEDEKQLADRSHRYQTPAYFEPTELQGQNIVQQYMRYAHICCTTFSHKNPDDFYYKILGQKDSRTFVTNLFPIACPEEKGQNEWPPQYDRLFGFKTKPAYRDFVEHQTNRLDQLSALAEDSLIVCHGVGHWPLFQKVFAPSQKMIEMKLHSRYLIKHSEGHTLFLLPFLGRGQFSYEAAKEAGSLLRLHNPQFFS